MNNLSTMPATKLSHRPEPKVEKLTVRSILEKLRGLDGPKREATLMTLFESEESRHDRAKVRAVAKQMLKTANKAAILIAEGFIEDVLKVYESYGGVGIFPITVQSNGVPNISNVARLETSVRDMPGPMHRKSATISLVTPFGRVAFANTLVDSHITAEELAREFHEKSRKALTGRDFTDAPLPKLNEAQWEALFYLRTHPIEKTA